MTYDAVNQVIIPGDSVVFFRSGKPHLAVVTEELNANINALNMIDTIRVEFVLDPYWNRPGLPQIVKPTLLRNKLSSNTVVKVDHQTFRTMPMVIKQRWSKLSEENRHLEQRFQLQQAAIFEFLRDNFLNKKVRIPNELKQI